MSGEVARPTGAWVPRPVSRAGGARLNMVGVLRLGRPRSSPGTSRAGACGAGGAAARLAKVFQTAIADDSTKVVMSPGQILLPTAGKANDMVRARNAGARRGSTTDGPGPPPPSLPPPPLLVLPPSSPSSSDSPGGRMTPIVLAPSSPMPGERPDLPAGGPLVFGSTEQKAGLARHPTAPSLKLKDLQPEGLPAIRLGAAPMSSRTLLGFVREASQVEMSYPGAPWTPPPPPSPSHSQRERASTSSSTGRSLSPRRSKRHRTLTGSSEDEHFPPSSPEDTRSMSLRRSMKLLESLYNMRRVGKEEEGKKKDVDADDEEEEISEKSTVRRSRLMSEMLMSKVLGDVGDNEAKLGEVEDSLASIHQGQVSNLGGNRHATNVVAGRTLTVVKRKRSLLKLLEERLDEFQKVQATGKEITRRLKEDSNYDVPEALIGLDSIAEECAHHPGNPADANKSDFHHFASKFGLPKDHQIFQKVESACMNAVEFWAHTALEEVQAGTDPEVVAKILQVSKRIMTKGNAEEHEAVSKCKEVLANVLADSTVNMAVALQEKDTAAKALDGKGTPESARTASDAINQEIRQAVALGAEPSNYKMKKAKMIATELLTEEKERIAQQVYDYAKGLKEKDEMMAVQTQEAMVTGPASWAADSIEKEIKKAIENGVPMVNELLVEAKKLAKKLRDEDIGRRRQTAKSSGLFEITPEQRLYRNVRDLEAAKRLSVSVQSFSSLAAQKAVPGRLSAI